MTDCNSFERTLTELKIARAYGRLRPFRERSRSVGFARLDRQLRDPHASGPQADLDGAPLFWLELFDHSTKQSVDSFICHRLKDAVVIFDDFISQAARLNEPGGPDD